MTTALSLDASQGCKWVDVNWTICARAINLRLALARLRALLAGAIIASKILCLALHFWPYLITSVSYIDSLNNLCVAVATACYVDNRWKNIRPTFRKNMAEPRHNVNIIFALMASAAVITWPPDLKLSIDLLGIILER